MTTAALGSLVAIKLSMTNDDISGRSNIISIVVIVVLVIFSLF